jgi:hypothetical protein
LSSSRINPAAALLEVIHDVLSLKQPGPWIGLD